MAALKGYGLNKYYFDVASYYLAIYSELIISLYSDLMALSTYYITTSISYLALNSDLPNSLYRFNYLAIAT